MTPSTYGRLGVRDGIRNWLLNAADVRGPFELLEVLRLSFFNGL